VPPVATRLGAGFRLLGRNPTCLSKAFRTSAGAEAYCRRTSTGPS
jgi:hypothetical protein